MLIVCVLKNIFCLIEDSRLTVKWLLFFC